MCGSSGTGNKFLIHAPFATNIAFADTYRPEREPSHKPLHTPSCKSSDVTSLFEPHKNSTPAPIHAAFKEHVNLRASTLASSGNHHPPTISGCKCGSNSFACVASSQNAVGVFFFFLFFFCLGLSFSFLLSSSSLSWSGIHVATLSPAKAGAKNPPEATYPIFQGSKLLSPSLSFNKYLCPSGPASYAIPSTNATKSPYIRLDAKHKSK